MKFNVFSFIMLKYENKYFDGHVDVYIKMLGGDYVSNRKKRKTGR